MNTLPNPSREDTVTALLNGVIKIPHPLNPSLEYRVRKENTFRNPVYQKNESYGYSNAGVSPTIKAFKVDESGVSLPLGYLENLIELLKESSLSFEIQDERVSSHITRRIGLKDVSLRPYQKRAVNEALKGDRGVIVSPTGSGKTIIGLEIISRRKQRALILVHRKELALQWEQVILDRLGVKPGLIGGGVWKEGKEITIALIQTLASRKEQLDEIKQSYGLILVDEVHIIAAATFFDTVSRLPARYCYGLSATVNRRDGLEALIYRGIGPVISKIQRQEVEDLGATIPANVQVINTEFTPACCENWNDYINCICYSSARNNLIADLIQNHVKGAVLCLVDRIEHGESLSKILEAKAIQHTLVHGSLNKIDREAAMSQIRTAQVTIGTTGLLGEGLDYSHWSALVMASPISSEIKLMQAIGRIIRPGEGKEAGLVYDLKDDCAFAGSSFKSRFSIYKKHKIWVEFPEK